MDNNRINFSRISAVLQMPDLLGIQTEIFEEFLQANVHPSKRENKGLQQVFLSNFPILDNKELFRLDFIEYYIEKPRFTIEDCLERGLTYSAPIKAKLRLTQKDLDSQEFVNAVEQEVYLGNLPFMTFRGTFIINGAERVVVSQLHRSPGVAFSQTVHPNGTPIYTARIIPFKGSWVEFATDINYVMYVYIDRKKKFPATTLLRALGYESDEQILKLFNMIEEIKIKNANLENLVGRMIGSDIYDLSTGEIFLTRGTIFSEEDIERVKEADVEVLKFIKQEKNPEQNLIINTLQKDTSTSKEEALFAIYRQLRTGEAPDLDTATQLIDKLFFNDKRYDLGQVGRYRMNNKLKLNIPETTTVLTIEDIISIMKYLIDLKNGEAPVDDIDHLGNRRIRTVAEQLSQQLNIGMARMARTIKERMNMRDTDKFTPQDLVNARTIASVINAFFGTSQLSQFMDQTNPLAELTHKRRMSALGPGGLTRERAGFEVRDVHYTHYGRLCPIETPEGPNIGLISSLTIYARVNKYGFLETPYRKVINGKVSDEVEYISAEKEDNFIIAQANEPLNKNKFINERVKTRFKGEFPIVHPEDVHYMDVAPSQIVSAAAALIPFLEHDDANRALMGSNMQRQAVPLLTPEAPIVGTGMESKIARDSRSLIIAEDDGIVTYVDSTTIVVKYDINPNSFEALTSFNEHREVTYNLIKFQGTNQETCINQKAIVREGQRIKKGDVIADGPATDRGELALGRNILVAFMPWRGYNFEDAIIVSERLVKEDIFTSLHIQEFELSVRETKRGEEELTREIPNVSEEAVKNLDEFGVVREGAIVREGDILIGKITPKGETDPTPEEKLLRAIFGEKAGDVKDASLKAPPGLNGIVIKTRLFNRKRKDGETKKSEKALADKIEKDYNQKLQKHYNKLVEKLTKITEGNVTTGIRDLDGTLVLRSGTTIKPNTFAEMEDVTKLDYTADWFESKKINKMISALFTNYFNIKSDIEEEYKKEKIKLQSGDELPPGIVQLAKVYVAKKRKLTVGDKMAGRHGNKGVVAKIVPVEDMPFLSDGTPVDIILNPLGVPSRMNLGQLYETVLGWAGKKLGVKFATPVFDGAKLEDVEQWLSKAEIQPGGKTDLYDGRTGEKFHQKVTCGYIYMLKLNHLVEDKIHARSIGPYSLITQQPLGGKAQFGGQRFGEMEVWALEGYGASHILQEILTVKSDDVNGRAKTYEALVKGENLPEPNIPEAFNVMIKELQGLALELKIN